jgi:hypothetical protein
MSELKRKFSDVSVQRMTNNLQTGSRETFQATVSSVDRERERECENTQKARGNCIHLRRFELLQLDVWLQDPNTPQILKLPEIFREVLKQIHLLFSYGTSRRAIIGNNFYSMCVKNIKLTKS